MRTGFQTPRMVTRFLQRFSGNPRKSIHNAKDIDELVDAINAGRRWVVVIGDKNDVLTGPDRMTLVLKNITPQSGTGMIYKGEWSEAAAAAGIKVQDVWTVSEGDTAGDYVCILGNPGVANPPDLGNAHWHAINRANTIGVWL